ncbi:MAG TPA: hypothetical protein VL947_05120, partial [Cytophagales bacterium]|nr:hypothetical protein [Cytophagales bacterium]
PSTVYTWKAEGGTIMGKVSGYELTSVDVLWGSNTTEGKVILSTYSEFLKCGGTDTLSVFVRPKSKILGTEKVCAYGQNTYAIQPDGDFIWSVSGALNIIESTTGKATWGGDAGKYKIFATPTEVDNFCNAKDSLEVELISLPTITSVEGPSEVDTSSYHSYQVSSNTNDVTYTWQVTGGQNISASGSNVYVKWGKIAPLSLSVTAITQIGACSSPLFELPVKINFKYEIVGNEEVCISTVQNYVANSDPEANQEIYIWSTTAGTGTGTDNSYAVTFNTPGNQHIDLKVQRGSKESVASKVVKVNAAYTGLTLKGSTEIDPAGTGTYIYTVSNPQNVSYTYTVKGAATHAKSGNDITVTWNGTGPFEIILNGIVAGSPCPGVPVITEIKKAPPLDNTIVNSKGACLNNEVEYSFIKDQHTKNLTWSVSGGGTIISTEDNRIKVLWGSSPGTYNVVLSYERFGIRTATLPVLVNTLPSPIINDQIICGSNAATLSTTQEYASYLWTVEENPTYSVNGPTPPVTLEGLYKVKVADANGCEGVGSKYITQIPIPKAKIFSDDDLSYCQSDQHAEITLKTMEGNAYTYEWYLNNVKIDDANTSTYKFMLSLGTVASYQYTVKASVKNCSQTASQQVSVRPKSNCTGGGGGGGEPCTEPLV